MSSKIVTYTYPDLVQSVRRKTTSTEPAISNSPDALIAEEEDYPILDSKPVPGTVVTLTYSEELFLQWDRDV